MMDCIIIHNKGWSCSNKADTGNRLVPLEDGKAIRYYTAYADDVFDCSGEIKVSTLVNFIFNDGSKQFGWLCEVLAVNNKRVNAQRKKILTELEIKGLITKIKK